MTEKLNKSALAKKLGICRSTLYYRSKMDIRDEELKKQIAEVLASNPCYGHKRIALELRQNKKKILRVMKKYCLEPRSRKRKGFVKHSNIGLPEAEHENRIINLCPIAPNVVWCGDFTYIKLGDSFVYLATVIDLFTREIIGFAISRRHNRFLIKEAMLDAIARRACLPTYFHSDQGSEYQSYEYVSFLEELGIKVSMSKKGCPWQNPYQESFYSQFKLELGNVNRFENDSQLAEAIYHQIYYYNHRRIHSALKMSPKQFYQLATSKVEALNKSV